MSLNPARLKAIAHDSPSAEIVMTDLALRQRQRNFSDIVRQKRDLKRQGEMLIEADVNRFWQLCEKEGLGVIVRGRKDKLERFDWHYSLKEIAKIALEGVGSVQNVTPSRLKETEPVVAAPKIPKFVAKAKEMLAAKGEAYIAPVVSKKDLVKLDGTDTPVKLRDPQGNVSKIVVALRSDFLVEIKVPANVTKEEMQIVANVLMQSVS